MVDEVVVAPCGAQSMTIINSLFADFPISYLFPWPSKTFLAIRKHRRALAIWWPRKPGPWIPGPHVPGPRVPEPHVPGPRVSGPHVPGPRVPGPSMPEPCLASLFQLWLCSAVVFFLLHFYAFKNDFTVYKHCFPPPPLASANVVPTRCF